MGNRIPQGAWALLAMVGAALLVYEAVEDGWSKMSVAFLLNLIALTFLSFVVRRADARK